MTAPNAPASTMVAVVGFIAGASVAAVALAAERAATAARAAHAHRDRGRRASRSGRRARRAGSGCERASASRAGQRRALPPDATTTCRLSIWSSASSCIRRRSASVRSQSTSADSRMDSHMSREACRSPPASSVVGGKRAAATTALPAPCWLDRTNPRPPCSPAATSSGRSRRPACIPTCRLFHADPFRAARSPGRDGRRRPGYGSARKIAPNRYAMLNRGSRVVVRSSSG